MLHRTKGGDEIGQREKREMRREMRGWKKRRKDDGDDRRGGALDA